MHTVARLAAMVLMACGGRTMLSGADDDQHPFSSHPPCASTSGVRICGDGCPALGATMCPGYGCTDAIADDGSTASAGICWSDTAETQYLCDDCNEGDACVQRVSGELECVPADVCAALWDLGVTNACRYADKRTYDHRALPEGATGCPSKTVDEWHACGGDCPPCPAPTRCDGVSPDHPFGVCHGAVSSLSPYNPQISCSNALFCDVGTGPSNVVCAVPDVPAEDFDVAFDYGICMKQVDCLDLASRFPGGLGCYDATRSQVH